jgi:hypothetical protein
MARKRKQAEAGPSRVRSQNPYFSRPPRSVQKIFTPEGAVFPVFLACFASPSLENHDFYPTAPLHGGFIAM